MANPTLDDDKESLKKERRRAASARWYKKNREKVAAYHAKRYKNNPDKFAKASKKWRMCNKKKVNDIRVRWKNNNKEKVKAAIIKWRKNNPEKQRLSSKLSKNKLYATSEGKLNNALSKHMRRCLSKTTETASQLKHSLPYTIAELQVHIERQFTKGMSWSNRKDWHIDHIIPLSSFKFTSSLDSEFQAAWALSNLRPLWAKENLVKNKKKLTLL